MRLVFAAIAWFLAGVFTVSADELPAQPIKSATDDKLYRYLLLDNRLKVLLVSDDDADKAGASLDIAVGSGSDPEDWPGLVHFLEHMLFLGTARYPEAGAYPRFISASGGSHNAYTALDHTNYFFSISDDRLYPALQRFSRFFIDPLFDPAYVDRERAVVDSEYQSRRKDDHRRIWAASRQAINPAHPASRFAVGTVDTLRDRAGITARDRLIEFYQTYYSANLMTLSVVGRQPLDQLEQWVRELFADIPDRQAVRPVFAQPYFAPATLPASLHVIPEGRRHSLRFTFPIPSTRAAYRSKPGSYIANLIGHEGEGSLLALLKARGWAESLSAGVGFMDAIQGDFRVQIGLTQAGLGKIDDIARLLFTTIDLIRRDGVTAERYAEQRRLSRLAFQFAEEQESGQLVRSIATDMRHYAVPDMLRGAYLMEQFDRPAIERLLASLRPDNLLLRLVAERDQKPFIQEPFYQVEYALTPIDAQRIAAWSKPDGDARLALPPSNPFVPQRLALQPLELVGDKPRPLVVADEPGLLSYYRGDQSFNTPRAGFYFSVKSPLASSSARHTVMTELLVRLLNEQLNTVAYAGYLAGLNYRLYRHARGYSVRITGYEDRQPVMLQAVLDAIAEPDFSADKLAVAKAALTRELSNAARATPSTQTVNEVYRLLIQPTWSEAERLAVLPQIELDDIRRHAEQLSAAVSLTTLSHGDVSVEVATEMTRAVQRVFAAARWLPDVPPVQVRRLPPGKRYLRSLEVAHTDNALAMYFQAPGSGDAERAKMALLTQLLRSGYYFRLRTSERVGYLVYAAGLEIQQVPGLLLSVQSSSHGPTDILRLNQAFLESALELDELRDPEVFEQVRQGLLSRLLARDKRLVERTNRYWQEIDQRHFDFDSRARLAAIIASLGVEEMRDYFQRLVVSEPRQLVVQSAAQTAEGKKQMITGDAYQDIAGVADFRQQLPVFFAPDS